MSATACSSPICLATLIGYWLGELDPANEARVDQHLLGCSNCSESLQSLVGLAGGIRGLVREGGVPAVVTGAFVARLAEQGLRLREYRVPCDGSVHCTVAPDDEVLVSRLEAPLAGIEQVDAVLLGFGEAGEERLQDVPFNQSTGEILLIPRIADIRAAGAHTARVRLLAVDREAERSIGEYTFFHTPWPAG